MTKEVLEILDHVIRFMLWTEVVIYVFLIISQIRRRNEEIKRWRKLYQETIEKMESFIVPNERQASPTYTMTIEGETVTYEGKTSAEICTELEQKKAPRRIRHLAFCAKKVRVRKKNRARLKKYERK